MADKQFLSTLQHIKLVIVFKHREILIVTNHWLFNVFIWSTQALTNELILDYIWCRVKVVVSSLCRFCCITRSSDKKSVELLRNVLYLTFKVNNLAKHFCLCSLCVNPSTPLHVPICIVHSSVANFSLKVLSECEYHMILWMRVRYDSQIWSVQNQLWAF